MDNGQNYNLYCLEQILRFTRAGVFTMLIIFMIQCSPEKILWKFSP